MARAFLLQNGDDVGVSGAEANPIGITSPRCVGCNNESVIQNRTAITREMAAVNQKVLTKDGTATKDLSRGRMILMDMPLSRASPLLPVDSLPVN